MTGDGDLWHELRAGPPEDRTSEARLAGQQAMAVLLRTASGTSVADWVMSEAAERAADWMAGLVRLVRAAGASLFAYFDAPPWSRARSDVLLAGAQALGISTEWGGWAA